MRKPFWFLLGLGVFVVLAERFVPLGVVGLLIRPVHAQIRSSPPPSVPDATPLSPVGTPDPIVLIQPPSLPVAPVIPSPVPHQPSGQSLESLISYLQEIHTKKAVLDQQKLKLEADEKAVVEKIRKMRAELDERLNKLGVTKETGKVSNAPAREKELRESLRQNEPNLKSLSEKIEALKAKVGLTIDEEQQAIMMSHYLIRLTNEIEQSKKELEAIVAEQSK